MELVIGMIIVVALIVGFMVANDISERQSYEDVRKELGEKLLKKEKEKEKKKRRVTFCPLPFIKRSKN
jgi:2-keto-4-pentenoate hydratase/2-oxohepta-3-ene-1,7-dioic acid hydratase in catechol pathway